MTERHRPAHPKRFKVRRPQDTQQEVGAQGEGAEEVAHESLKEEVARDLGLADDLKDPDELSVREAGKIGGQMVRRLIQMGKQQLAEKQRRAPPSDAGEP